MLSSLSVCPAVALFLEILGFFVVWKGQGFFRFSFFTPPRKYPADMNASASVYPSRTHSRHSLLEDGKGGRDATVTQGKAAQGGGRGCCRSVLLLRGFDVLASVCASTYDG